VIIFSPFFEISWNGCNQYLVARAPRLRAPSGHGGADYRFSHILQVAELLQERPSGGRDVHRYREDGVNHNHCLILSLKEKLQFHIFLKDN
jgi:hypothetical protein